jgi:tRNA pseudouridine65 synthase
VRGEHLGGVQPLSLDILFEDEHLLAVCKPAKLLVHRGIGRDRDTLVDRLRDDYSMATVRIVHRLDRATSGVLLVAKTLAVAQILNLAFDERRIVKTYLALVRGEADPSGVIDSPLSGAKKGEAKPAHTAFDRLAILTTEPRTSSLLRVAPTTGRYQQIRRHLRRIDHPLIGDSNHGRPDINRAFAANYGLDRLALHAESVRFKHPISKQLETVTAALPSDLKLPLQRMGLPASVGDLPSFANRQPKVP